MAISGRGLQFGLLVAALLAISACAPPPESLLRAKLVEHRSELVGGPVAMADLGDFVLENDKLRAAILRPIDSPGPGVYGGSLVDLDIRRPRIDAQGAHGRDRFAETFPVANLLVPEPDTMEVSVLKDGSDGQEAAIRVEGQGEFLFEALGVLRTKQAVLDVLFPDVRTRIRFTTDYIVRPGDRHITIRTVLRYGDENPANCPSITSCVLECPNGYRSREDGCLECECGDLVQLENFSEPASVFGRILGDNPAEENAELRAGLLGGDFVFFGNQNDVFAPGPGFDELSAVQDAANTGQNTFQTPLVYDFVAASGGDVSYGYFTKKQGDGPDPLVNVPLFASAATTFLSAGINCKYAPDDDASCDQNRAFEYERFLAVGDGDINSVTEEMYRVRGTPTGTVNGVVYWANGVAAVENAHLFVFSNPAPPASYPTLDELVNANLDALGHVGLVNAMDADVGDDRTDDGAFTAKLPPGDYVIVARDSAGLVNSTPQSIRVEAGSEITLTPSLGQTARVQFRVADERGQAMPAKIALVSLDANGAPLYGDGVRRIYLGDSRLGDGRRLVHVSASGQGDFEVEPGNYEVIVSRGIEYGVHRQQISLRPDGVASVDATLVHEVDTTGWMSADMHLHSRPSFDSGLPIEQRVRAVVAEGVEFAVSSDHDVNTDYLPTIRRLALEPFVKHAIGSEVTTLEQGHLIGFPVAYDELTVPTHGSHDWRCQQGGEIISGIRSQGDGIDPLVIIAHPRDGFFGYIEQLGVDGYDFSRTPTLLEESNPVFRTADCSFDAWEAISAKRFDLHRTPTVSEVVDYNRCLKRINDAMSLAGLEAACPEFGAEPLLRCAPEDRFLVCKTRTRSELATWITRRILERTPAEQAAEWTWPGSRLDSQEVCDLDAIGDGPVDAAIADLPCAYRVGQIDDFFRLAERGMTPTQVGSSDSHNGAKEPGFPRTYFKSKTDSPAALTTSDAVDAIRRGAAFATYGPFVRVAIGDATMGDVATVVGGGPVTMDLDVLTASWFGVDRVEIYMNGELRRVIEVDVPPSAIEDVRGKVTLSVPPRDSWIVVAAMGLRPENFMGAVSLGQPFGEVQLAQVASDAFSRIPVINTLFGANPTIPDWSPTIPYAVTNPIYLDVDGNGLYDAPLPLPEFCSQACDPGAAADTCPGDQICLDAEKQCGFPITGGCTRRVAATHGH